MFKNLHLKSLLLLAVMLMGGGNSALAEESTSTLTFTAKCKGSGTADDGVVWTVTSDGTESTFDNDRGIHYGTGSAAVKYITLTTSGIPGTIKKIVVNAAAASSASVSTTVGGAAFGGDAQTLSSSAADYTFNGSASGEIVVTVTKPSSAKKALYVKSIAVTYETTKPIIKANNVNLAYNVTSGEIPYTITNPSSSTLSAKTTDDWITNVTVDGDNNKVTFVTTVNTGAEREGTITLSYDGADNKVVTITQAAHTEEPTITLDFTDNTDWGFPEGSSNKMTKEQSFTDGNGYTIKLAAADGYYFNSDKYLLFGKSGSTLTLPAFPFNVSKIEVVGRGEASGSVVMNIYVGEEAVSTETTGATGKNTYEIAAGKQTAGTIYTLKVGSNHNTQITSIKIYGYDNVPVGPEGFATYCSPFALDFYDVSTIEAYTAAIVKDGSNVNVVFTKVEGSVPANTGLLVKATAKGTSDVPAVASSPDVDNVLVGTVDGTTINGTETGTDYYVLKENAKGGVGFYKVINPAYIVRPKSAYLAVAKGTLAKGFIPVDGTTAIELVDTANEVAAPVYNLQGQRVSNGYKGVVIVNGKKVIR